MSDPSPSLSSPTTLPAFPLATKAVHRILAWPRYEEPDDLDWLIGQFGPLLRDRTDVCLCLRHHPTRDIPAADAARAVAAAFTRAFGATSTIEALLIDDRLDDLGWTALGRAVTAVLALPSLLTDEDRQARLTRLGHPLATIGSDLQAMLGSSAAPARPGTSNAGAPMVSVIVPTFNRPAFLARALESLAQQTLTDFEVVVINDAGRPIDAVLESFNARLAITSVRLASNRGCAAARNSALALARGKYVAYLDDDDRYHPEHLQTLLVALRSGPHKVAYADAVWMLEEKDGADYQPMRSIWQRSSAVDREQLLIANPISLLSLMHERACLDVAGRFDESLATHEDWDLIIRLAWQFGLAHVAATTGTVSWRQDGSSARSAQSADFGRTMRLIHQRYQSLVKDNAEIQRRQAAMLPPADAPVPAANTVDDCTAATDPVVGGWHVPRPTTAPRV
ncbi:MAG TPA: glycosyltransferase family A protein [Polyangia bacterium]|jgi:hypothetical protein